MKLGKSKTPARSVELRIGVDTGGTFTDFVAFSGSHRVAFKIPSTPHAPADAILEGIIRILAEDRGSRQSRGIKKTRQQTLQVEIAHGTTVATNTLLERKGARTALITTSGFEDVIEIGRQARPDLYNLNVLRPEPVVPSELRFGVRERIASDGRVIEALDRPSVESLPKLLKDAKVESVAISLLFSFANPRHEKAVADALACLGIPLSLSSEILPEYREFERTSTVVVNAYLAPRVGTYLNNLKLGIIALLPAEQRPSLRVMQSSGGSISADIAAREPVRTILSGPAGGVVAALKVADLAGINELITFDMGGTSTDVALCRGGARTTNEAQLAGLPVAVPVLDIHTVGAGGGSIAFVDPGGALRVGPESAGADPGPACYGVGTRPTVTDANLVLGRFGTEGLLAGQIKLDPNRAAMAIDDLASALCDASGRAIRRHEAALGVVQVANVNMEQALRLVSIERGHDPRHFTLVSFGGAGGLHAVALAEALRIPQVIIPADPGNFSALGVLLAEVVKDYSRTVMLTVAPGSPRPREVAGHFAALTVQALSDLRNEGFPATRVRLIRSLAVRYRGQSFELDVPWSPNFATSFHRAHRERYGHDDPLRDVEIVNLRLRGVGVTTKPSIRRERVTAFRTIKARGESLVRIGRAEVMTPVFDREMLRPGSSIWGPGIVIEYGSTTFLPPNWRLKVDGYRNMVLSASRNRRGKAYV